MAVLLFLCMIIPLFSSTTIYTSIDCISVISEQSGQNDDDVISVQCSDAGDQYSDYVVTSCGWWQKWRHGDGSWIDGDGKCNARNGEGGGYILAIAQCCNFPQISSLSCTVDGTVGENYVEDSCSSGTAIGCAAQTFRKAIKKVQPKSTRTCQAWTNGRGNIKLQANCCSFPSSTPLWGLTCDRVEGAISKTDDDAVSRATCSNLDTSNGEKWFLASCNGGSASDDIDGWYSENGDTCTARNAYGGGGATAVALCCTAYWEKTGSAKSDLLERIYDYDTSDPHQKNYHFTPIFISVACIFTIGLFGIMIIQIYLLCCKKSKHYEIVADTDTDY